MELNGAKLKNFYGISTALPDEGFENANGVKVSHYQRPFRWEEEHVEKLILDWAENKTASQTLLHDEGKGGKSFKYFSGCVVSVSSDSEAHQLVDGQQRITTLFLANFIQFLIAREMVFKILRKDQSVMFFNEAYSALLSTSKFVFNNVNLYNNLKELKNKIENELKKNNNSDGNNKHNKALDLFLETIPIPLLNDSTHESYYRSMLNLFNDNSEKNKENLFLSYSRSSFNTYLKRILSCTIYTLRNDIDPKFEFKKMYETEDGLNSVELSYHNALNKIFEVSKDLVGNIDLNSSDIKSWEVATKQLKILTRFTNEVQFCLVQTNSEKDAYKLFEVLNDRALALDDLDLIKNLFYRNFVEKNTFEDSKNEKLVNQQLEKLDDQWIDDIFTSNMSPTKKKLVTYFAITYITGSTNLKFNSNQDYRESLERSLKEKVSDVYSFNDIQRDFNIFNACALLVDCFDMKFKNKDLKALYVQYDSKASSVERSIHFLHAQGQEGVLSGLVNTILRATQDKYSNFLADNFNKDYFNKHIKEFFSKVMLDDIENVTKQSKYLWQYSIYSKDSKAPRDFAKMVISKNHLKSSSLEVVAISDGDQKELEKTFTEFLERWQYKKNNSKNSLKPRILFAILIQSKEQDNKLVKDERALTLKIEQCSKLHLDHMEPDTIEISNIEQYFDHGSRQIIVNGLGNMMPINDVNNSAKGNSPLTNDSSKYYSFIGDKHHFLISQTFNLLSKGKDEKFFNDRREKIIKWFIEATKI